MNTPDTGTPESRILAYLREHPDRTAAEVEARLSRPECDDYIPAVFVDGALRRLLARGHVVEGPHGLLHVPEADIPTQALRELHEWAASDPDGLSENGRRIFGKRAPGRLWLLQDSLADLLRGWGFDARSTLEAWHRRGWTLTEGGRPTCRETLRGVRVRAVVIPLDDEGVPLALRGAP